MQKIDVMNQKRWNHIALRTEKSARPATTLQKMDTEPFQLTRQHALYYNTAMTIGTPSVYVKMREKPVKQNQSTKAL